MVVFVIGGTLILDERFLERMSDLLGDEYEVFLRALEDSAVRGIRVNKIKTNDSVFLKVAEEYHLKVEPISYWDSGYIVEGGEGLGNSPLHHAGGIYIQDPGAISTIAALKNIIKPGDKVADLCAAPGGKTTQLAELIGDDGFLLSNEYVKKRATVLMGNIERMGIKNCAVTSCDLRVISSALPGVFDIVVVDAPCSGEGMFRKGEIAKEEWSPENVLMSAERQHSILESAKSLVKPGGYLLYSTCTYSLEENEYRICRFLEDNPDFQIWHIDNPELISNTKDGVISSRSNNQDIKHTRRFYPHVAKGEGQYLALLKYTGDREYSKNKKAPDSLTTPTTEEKKLLVSFLQEHLEEIPQGQLKKLGGRLVLCPENMLQLPLPLSSCGITLGEIKGKLFLPHHHLFSALGCKFKNKISPTDEDILKYLRGEEISVSNHFSGYCAVIYRGMPIGGGKISSGMMKNHYPKGLRLPPI